MTYMKIQDNYFYHIVNKHAKLIQGMHNLAR